MARFHDVANELAKKFILSKDKKYALNQIVYDINYLVYSDTKQPLTYHAKSAVFKHIFNIISGREELVIKEGEKIAPQFSDIVIFFERRNALLRQLQTGIKKQAELN